VIFVGARGGGEKERCVRSGRTHLGSPVEDVPDGWNGSIDALGIGDLIGVILSLGDVEIDAGDLRRG
jgi:hypothetical protein